MGLAVQRLGGGRRHKGDAIDLGVGATLHAKVGDLHNGLPLRRGRRRFFVNFSCRFSG
ncbi:MAG: hypothetical protein ACNA7T_05620 [Haliea sp.]